MTTYKDILARRAAREAEGKPVFSPENKQVKHTTWDEIKLKRQKLGLETTFEIPEQPDIRDSDDDPTLPPGYTFEEHRHTDFLTSERSDGLEGLAWAVLLTAVSDGCCPLWTKEIAEFYQLNFDHRILYRRPIAAVVQRDDKSGYKAVAKAKLNSKLIP